MKKNLWMITLVCVLVVTMGAGVCAASGVKYVEMGEPLWYSYSGLGSLNGDTLDLGEIYASDEVEIKLPLVSEMFVADPAGTQPATGQSLTSADIRNSKIAVRNQIKVGSKVIKDVSVDTRESAVMVTFVDEWVSTEEQDFEVYVYLTIDGERQDDYGLTIIGTMTNPVIDVYSDFSYVDLSAGYVAEAKEFVENIEVDLGNGVTIFTKLFVTKKYYGTASRQPDEAADIVIKKYPDIDNVIILKTVGLNSTGDVVRLSTDYSDYFVYDKDLNYLGQSDQMLPHSAVYYLANQKLNPDDKTDAERRPAEPTRAPREKASESAADNTETGENSGNINANPNTGR